MYPAGTSPASTAPAPGGNLVCNLSFYNFDFVYFPRLVLSYLTFTSPLWTPSGLGAGSQSIPPVHVYRAAVTCRAGPQVGLAIPSRRLSVDLLFSLFRSKISLIMPLISCHLAPYLIPIHAVYLLSYRRI